MIATICIGIVLAAAVTAAIRKLAKNRKQGGCGCGRGRCARQSVCRSAQKKNMH